MRTDYPTEDEMRANFEEMLASVSGGGGLRTETGLDNETENVLWAISRVRPEAPEELVTAARVEFAAQLDGSHKRARRAALTRRLDGLDREAKG
ncbi:hypothetical protein [Nocardia sp. XZ_19_231]|uniref:hypothetical protein n=1 Tax=Nocardia sp. XZ_19_231 TaxID=2769252 RepID=UPI00188F49F1|nr:hypothetical protein [Nocardia sp. XZ_19_231]